MSAAYYLLAIGAGLGITLQTTLNGQLAKGVGGDSVAAALFSFIAGAVCLGLFSLMRGGIVTSLAAIPAQPWWSLLGGPLGAGALLSYVALAPKISLSALLELAIAGKITSSLAIDHFGLMGAVERPVSFVKFGGAVVMLTGLAIALFGDRWSALSSCLTPKTIANASIVSELSPCSAVSRIGSEIDFRNLARSTERPER
jgi:transporter family-2 protein